MAQAFFSFVATQNLSQIGRYNFGERGADLTKLVHNQISPLKESSHPILQAGITTRAFFLSVRVQRLRGLMCAATNKSIGRIL